MMLADVTVPWGDWVVSGMTALQPVVTLALTGVATWIIGAYMPPWLKAFAGDAAQRRINQVLEKAVQSAIAQTAGAISGERTTIPIGSEILARAAQYAVDQAPELVKHATHDQMDNLLKMILARMEALHVAPADFDISQARTTAAQKTGFDFSKTISAQLGK